MNLTKGEFDGIGAGTDGETEGTLEEVFADPTMY